ncbi:S41 family peptidase [Myxococcaceae bacterium GXIMD 01537]
MRPLPCFTVLATLLCSALAASAEPDRPLDAATRNSVIDAVLANLKEHYVFPEALPEIERELRQHQARGHYDTLSSGRAFADSLTSHLQGITHDKHMRVRFQPDAAPGNSPPPGPLVPTVEEERRDNFGFRKVEVLDGNVGYLRIDRFANAQHGGATLAAAMALLAQTDALIIDLRSNRGGGRMENVLATYLFDGEPVHLSNAHYRQDNSTIQFWTLPYVPGPRYLDKPVYILTSKRTFSAAEAFTYSLRNLGRAVVVGETTSGAANPNAWMRIHPSFLLSTAIGRSISPITNSNWEGVGVQPDVQVEESEALKTALRLALRTLLDSKDAKHKDELARALKGLAP